MKILQPFVRYACVGGANTLIHALVFFSLVHGANAGQGSANVAGFLMAVTFSYLANARWTFRARMSLPRYLLFTAAMAMIAYGTGQLGQGLAWPPLLTFCLFSALSLALGYALARGVVFKGASA